MNPVTIRALTPGEITSILARNRVGRIAFSLHDRVDIEPIHFVYQQGWIYGRTSRGAKLTTLQKNRWVAFEVDEVQSVFDWRSVVVHGAVYVLEPDGPSTERELWEHAVQLLRRIVPETLTEADPTPERDVVFRIAMQESSGRAAFSSE